MNPKTRENFSRYIASVVQYLPPEEKYIVSLYYVEKLTFPEIAGVLELSEAEVRKKYVRAINRCLNLEQK